MRAPGAGAATRWRCALLGALLLAAGSGLAAQARRPHAPARARARAGSEALAARTRAAESRRWLFTAEADLRAQAFASAERAFSAALQLEPEDAAARAGLARARDGACRAGALGAASAGQWAAAAAQLQGCDAAQPAEAGAAAPDARALAALQDLGRAQSALARGDWAAADGALRQAAELPPNPALAPAWAAALAPAYLSFGAGHPLAAARRLRALAVHPPPAVTPRALAQFQAFLRNRARRRGARAAALPLLALYLLALGASLFWGLRRLYRNPAAEAAA